MYRSPENPVHYWFVTRGSLHTSTLIATKENMVKLLDLTAHTKIHNDPAISIAAYKQNIEILQLDAPLNYQDVKPKSSANMTFDPASIEHAYAWFYEESKDWDSLAKRGYLYHAMTFRMINCGKPWQALRVMLANYHPKFGVKNFIKFTISILTNNKAKLILARLKRV